MDSDDDQYYVNCYYCGKAGYMFNMVMPIKKQFWHPECYEEWFYIPSQPELSQQEIDEITRDPHAWHKAKAEEFKSVKQATGKHRYLITFTHDPKKCSKEALKDRVKYEMQRKHIVDYTCIFENEEENLHAHAKVITNVLLKHNMHFKTYIKKCGFVDIRKAPFDNGILEYFVEGEIISKN